jgi:EAL domain-containing protein (putative c-di-GMP-specific phosphodiesterase class I)
MGAHVQVRRRLESDLRGAVDRGELELYFQPIVGLGDRRIRAFEALLRWHHPVRGLVMPDQFIALGEETGLIEAIGAWVLNDACSRAAQWPSAVGIAVNLSPVQLRSGNLVGIVTAALQASGLSPTRLELEITESVPLFGNAQNLAMLHELRALGVRVSLDDFGVGYSSLGYLRTFPFSKIKIDRSFVRDVTGSRDAAAIVRAVTSLGDDLGMAITAEGVETDEQWRLVRDLGCDEAQGYFISGPLPAGEVHAILKVNPFLAVGAVCAG